ncbi:hypothetical protein N7534_007706 [Penicillium rubens]|nr:hypothetical protein N7534_007706 [Penicillium rubens]
MGLQGIQMHTLVFQHVDTHQNDPECHELRVLSERDSSYDSPLNGQEIIRMKDLYGKILGEILSRSKVVATTLSNASQELWKGENMIPMTMESMRVVVLIGDPYQLPPTVMSDGANEGAEFLKRSLLARLMEAGYPQVSLNIDYRNHPQILELFNKAIYSGKLISGR